MGGATLVSLAVGVVLLVVGAELLVRGAAAIAGKLGIQPVIIGLTVVAFGTSAPELAVSLGAGLRGDTDVAFGNVVGSNIVNVLFILGASAMVRSLVVTQRIVKLDVPLVIGASVAVGVMALDGGIGRIDGAFLFAAVLAYTSWLIRGSRRETVEVKAEYSEAITELEGAEVRRPLAVQAALVAIGLGGLVAGAQLLVSGATTVAEELGVSQLVIGLTVVAVGTSLPELATSMLAALRGQRDIAVGNVVGSNLFNLLCVLGATGVVSPNRVEVSEASLRLDLPVMVAAALVLVPIFWNGFEISRWEGAVLVAAYLAYVSYLVLDASDHRAASGVGLVSLVVAPVVVMVFGVFGYQGWRRHVSVPN